MLMQNNLVKVEFIDTYSYGDNDQYLEYGFDVTVLESNEVFSIGYDRNVHTISSVMLNNQVVSELGGNTSSVSGETVKECHKEFDKYEYLVKCMCKAIIEFL